MLVKATARLKYCSIPPRKMRLVAGMVKGLPVEKALNILNFTPKIAAHHLAKTLKSAAANALSIEGTDHLKPESLVVAGITVDAAPTAKRIRFQSMGRAFRYLKRHCHLTIHVAGETDVEVKTRPAATSSRKKGTKDSEPAKPVSKKAVARKKTTRKSTKKTSDEAEAT